MVLSSVFATWSPKVPPFEQTGDAITVGILPSHLNQMALKLFASVGLRRTTLWVVLLSVRLHGKILLVQVFGGWLDGLVALWLITALTDRAAHVLRKISVDRRQRQCVWVFDLGVVLEKW